VSGAWVRRFGASRSRTRSRSSRRLDEFGRARGCAARLLEGPRAAPIFDDHIPPLQAGIEAVDLFGYDAA
jgi:hypothetical protein